MSYAPKFSVPTARSELPVAKVLTDVEAVVTSIPDVLHRNEVFGQSLNNITNHIHLHTRSTSKPPDALARMLSALNHYYNVILVAHS